MTCDRYITDIIELHANVSIPFNISIWFLICDSYIADIHNADILQEVSIPFRDGFMTHMRLGTFQMLMNNSWCLLTIIVTCIWFGCFDIQHHVPGRKGFNNGMGFDLIVLSQIQKVFTMSLSMYHTPQYGVSPTFFSRCFLTN